MIGALENKRVALVHHWLLSMRGGERVLEAIATMIPDAPIYTLFAKPDLLSDALRRREIRASFLDRIPGARNHHRECLPLYKRAVRSLDCRGFDVVIVSDAAVVKGVRVDPRARVFCYCHSPMRSIWEMTETYAKQLGHVKGASLRWIGKGIRAWDCNAARRVDHFAANSRYVADRIRRYYGKESRVIYPPVRVPAACPKRAPGEGYLMVGELSEYKRADLGVAACVRLGRSLTVIGDGPQMSLLRSMANEGVELLGRTSDEVIREHLSQARALLFCAEEDFGIVPVEAMAAGCPVIAYGRGGGAETVVDGETGVLFDEHTPDGVAGAIERFEELADRLEPEKLHTRALAFAEDRFRSEFAAWISDGLSVSCQVMADSTD